jgi:hypothetical protein
MMKHTDIPIYQRPLRKTHSSTNHRSRVLEPKTNSMRRQNFRSHSHLAQKQPRKNNSSRSDGEQPDRRRVQPCSGRLHIRVQVPGRQERLDPQQEQTRPAAKAVRHFPHVVVLGPKAWVRSRANGDEDKHDEVRENRGRERYAATLLRLDELGTRGYGEYGEPGDGGECAAAVDAADVEDSRAVAAYSKG